MFNNRYHSRRKICANALLANDDYLMYKCRTVKQAMGRGDWPMFEEAINAELFGHQKIGTFKLEDEEYVFNQGDPFINAFCVVAQARFHVQGAYYSALRFSGRRRYR